MIYFLGEGAGEVHNLNTVTGTLGHKVRLCVNLGQLKESLLIEVDSDEYDFLRTLCPLIDVDHMVVTNIPDVASPRSFLFEDNPSYLTVWTDELEDVLRIAKAPMTDNPVSGESSDEVVLDEESIGHDNF